MDDRKMEIIKQLMEELQDEMAYSEDDFGERLGREKPEVKIMKIDTDNDGMSTGDMCMDEEMEPESPEEKLKSRLMKLRG